MASEIRFAEVQRLLKRHGWTLTRIRGSHHYFTKPGRLPISIPVRKGRMVKAFYVRKIEKAIEEDGEEE